MTIMVDDLKVWTTKRPFHLGSCHLTTDGPLEELHAFAARIGMKRAWFQEHRFAPHYDLTPGRRVRAVALGAVEVDAFQQVLMRRAVGIGIGLKTRAEALAAPTDPRRS